MMIIFHKILKRIYYFYLFNYKGIHHLFTISLLFTMLYLSFGLKIFSDFIICIFSLIMNFYMTNWSISKSGLEETIEKEIKEIENKL